MLDPIFVRDNLATVRQRLSTRGVDLTRELEQLAELDAKRRQSIPAVERLKREQNTASEEVARAKKQGTDVTSVVEANKQRGQQIKQL
jgi:seryl-tRNA synthetase